MIEKIERYYLEINSINDLKTKSFLSKNFTIGISSERGNFTSLRFTYKNDPKASLPTYKYKQSNHDQSNIKASHRLEWKLSPRRSRQKTVSGTNPWVTYQNIPRVQNPCPTQREMPRRADNHEKSARCTPENT